MPVLSLPMFVEAAARASIILAATGLVAAALRRSSASARHLVWMLGLLSALAVPALSLALPKVELPLVKLSAAPAETTEGTGQHHNGGTAERRTNTSLSSSLEQPASVA